MEIHFKWIKGLWQLIRIVPVMSWSGAGVITTLLPILLFYQKSIPDTILQIFYLLFGGVCIQGILAHAFNDLVDDQSGTDLFTTGILSGGSRVLSTHVFTRKNLKRLAVMTLFLALLIDLLLFLSGLLTLAFILFIGSWSAVAYSLPPFRLSYVPFAGEWLCAFVAITALSLTPALLSLHSLPAWAFQNACLHGLWSLSWLMFHHIADVDADRKAVPKKNTTVVFFEQKLPFKCKRKLPAILYFLITAVFTAFIISERPFGAGVSLVLILMAFVTVISSQIQDPKKQAKSEIIIITLSILNALWLGLMPFN